MELLILPFCIPLMLIGWVLDATADSRRRQREAKQARLDEARWSETWAVLNGDPRRRLAPTDAAPTAARPSPPPR